MRTLTTLVALVLATFALVAPAGAGEEKEKEKEKPKGPPLVLRIEGTPLQILLDIQGFQSNPATLAKLGPETGRMAIAAGSALDGVLLSVNAEKDEGGHLTSAEWRQKLVGDKEDNFDEADVACVDMSEDKGGLRQADYRAYPVAAGWRFDIRVSQLCDPEESVYFGRRRIRAFVAAIRVGTFRRGSFADHPAEIVDQMHAVAVKHPEWRAAAEAAVAAKPDDWAAAFVALEACRGFGAPEADLVAARKRAVDVFTKANPTDAKAAFPWACVEEETALASHAEKKFKVAVVHLTKAFELATTSVPSLKGDIAWNLARSKCKAGDIAGAVATLKLAIEADPRLRAGAATEPDFIVARTRSDFKALVAPPAAPPK